MSKVNIDQRPLLLGLIGSALFLGSGIPAISSFGKDALRLYQEDRHGKTLFSYANTCSKSAQCRTVYWQNWQASEFEKTLYGGGILLGAVFSLAGSLWKPTVFIQRAQRMRSWQEFEVPTEVSSVPQGVNSFSSRGIL